MKRALHHSPAVLLMALVAVATSACDDARTPAGHDTGDPPVLEVLDLTPRTAVGTVYQGAEAMQEGAAIQWVTVFDHHRDRPRALVVMIHEPNIGPWISIGDPFEPLRIDDAPIALREGTEVVVLGALAGRKPKELELDADQRARLKQVEPEAMDDGDATVRELALDLAERHLLPAWLEHRREAFEQVREMDDGRSIQLNPRPAF